MHLLEKLAIILAIFFSLRWRIGGEKECDISSIFLKGDDPATGAPFLFPGSMHSSEGGMANVMMHRVACSQ